MHDDETELRIAKMTLQPGDTLVLQARRVLSMESHAALVAYGKQCVPEGVKVMVLDSLVDLVHLAGIGNFLPKDEEAKQP